MAGASRRHYYTTRFAACATFIARWLHHAVPCMVVATARPSMPHTLLLLYRHCFLEELALFLCDGERVWTFVLWCFRDLGCEIT